MQRCSSRTCDPANCETCIGYAAHYTVHACTRHQLLEFTCARSCFSELQTVRDKLLMSSRAALLSTVFCAVQQVLRTSDTEDLEGSFMCWLCKLQKAWRWVSDLYY